jgi:DUF4097 and DUF4098 domain-containing protein YvlB
MPTFETPGGRVALDVIVPAGAVSLGTWDEPRVEVEVTAVRGDDASAQAAAETRIEAVERGGRHEVSVRVPKREGRLGIFGRSPELLVAIRCPAGADLELTTQSADLDARGRLGEVAARSASGDAMVADTAGLSFTTASGDLVAGAVAGALTTKSASGDVAVRSVAGAATVNTVSGDVRLGETVGLAGVNTVSGDVELDAVAGGARVSCVSGDVRVATRPGLALWIDVQSVSGSVSSDLEVGEAPGGGDAQVELRVRTVSGDVRITRAAAAAASDG